MPYCKAADKTRLNSLSLDTVGRTCSSPGELNYAITTLMIGYLDALGLSYANAAETLAGGNEAVAEFRRRVLVPYEDSKIRENGDVYPNHLLTKEAQQ